MSIKTLLTVIFCFIIFDVVGQDTITIDSNRNLREISQDSIIEDVKELEYWDNDNLFPYYDVKVEDVDSFEVCLKRDTSLRFVIPHHGRISSRFGPRRGRLHKGFDIRLTIGDSVLAVYPGVVRYAKYNKGGYGKLIVIRHPNGLESYYAHLNNILVSPNEEVKAGQLIGKGGRTAVRRSSPHLHFELRFMDHPINPDSLFNWETGEPWSDTICLTAYKLRFPAYGSGGYGRNIHNKNGTSSSRFYKIRKGDTLYGIALKHHTTVNRLCQLNGIRRNTILRIGRVLQLP